ncbi:MAG: pseudouridine synthase [Thermoleophilia bacterium]|jgi:23S rRNA pseudouridine2605 synthase
MGDSGPAEPMRIHRAIALAGVASRRAAERMVAEGRVAVNGRTAIVGQLVEPADHIAVDGEPLRGTEDLRAYLLHKKAGVVSTAHDPQGRPTVLDDLPSDVRLYPVGRLDYGTTGALLITNDGELAARLMHPRSKAPKTYEVLLKGRVSAATVRKLRDGVHLDDGMTLPARVEPMDRRHPGGTWLTIELTEGRNRQIRRMGEAVGHPVMRLHRARYAGLSVRGMAPGKWRPVTRAEWHRLGQMVGLKR